MKCKLYPNWKLHPILKYILSVFYFVWFLGCDLYVDDKNIGLQGRHVDKMRISYNNERDRFQVDYFCNRGYSYFFIFRNECPPK